MPNPYALELRERAVAAYEAGEGTYVEIAEQFVINSRTLERWARRKRTTRSVAARPKGDGRHSPVNIAVLDGIVREQPDRTTDELTRAYHRRVPKRHRVHRSSIFRALGRAEYVCKKNRPRPADQDLPEVQVARRHPGARSNESILGIS